MLEGRIWFLVTFNLFVLVVLALDLGVFHRKAHAISTREAIMWVSVWVALALVFNISIYFFWDFISPTSHYSSGEAALAFLTGYLIEESLSVDNVFVFALVFSYFAVPAAYQHRVLFWGVIGAIVMRGIFILAGGALLKEFHWLIYIFGAFLLFTGVKMALRRHEEVHPERNPLVKLCRRFLPVTDSYAGERFFVRRGGVLMATPLLLVLLVVESTDLLFAIDSIPAIFAVTDDPFIVYTSNVFAILGLRSLYFVLSGAMNRFHYLKPGLAAVLVFVGLKMVLADVYRVPVLVSLGVVAGILAIAILASWLRTRRLARTAEGNSPVVRAYRPTSD